MFYVTHIPITRYRVLTAFAMDIYTHYQRSRRSLSAVSARHADSHSSALRQGYSNIIYRRNLRYPDFQNGYAVSACRRQHALICGRYQGRVRAHRRYYYNLQHRRTHHNGLLPAVRA